MSCCWILNWLLCRSIATLLFGDSDCYHWFRRFLSFNLMLVTGQYVTNWKLSNTRGKKLFNTFAGSGEELDNKAYNRTDYTVFQVLIRR